MPRREINISEIPELKRFITEVSRNADKILIKGIQKFNLDFKNRVFKRGQDAEGQNIGKYSREWAAVRRSRGRRTDRVNLDFTGDLFSSVQPVTINKNQVQLKVINDRNVRKARENEQRFKKQKGTIFSASEAEVKAIEQAAEKVIIQILEREFSR